MVLRTWQGKERVGRIAESSMGTYTPPCVQERADGKLLSNTGSPGPVLHDDPEERDGVDGREAQEGGV